ncbi:hypothetical protein VTI28DRAFT_9468 [Corynascus sepedonium]
MKYNNIGLDIFILGFHLTPSLAAEVVFDDPNSSFDLPMRCKPSQGKQLTLSEDRKWEACWPPGTTLEGGEHTAFDCCSAGHSLAGSEETGYRCCPTGQTYDGHKFKKPNTSGLDVCQNGRVLVNGKPLLNVGKCYLFKMKNGQHLGFNKGWYAASKPSRKAQISRFKFCKDEACVRDVGNDINPGDPIRLMNDGHIGRTDKYENAGVFTISKWTKGKYCLSGFETGVGPTCPSEDPSLTFNTLDTESCLPLEPILVPCEIRNPFNNCVWSGSHTLAPQVMAASLF